MKSLVFNYITTLSNKTSFLDNYPFDKIGQSWILHISPVNWFVNVFVIDNFVLWYYLIQGEFINSQVVRGKQTTRCLWHAFKALGIGLLLMLLGACMATIGN